MNKNSADEKQKGRAAEAALPVSGLLRGGDVCADAVRQRGGQLAKGGEHPLALLLAQVLKGLALRLMEAGEELVRIGLPLGGKADEVVALIVEGALAGNNTVLLQPPEGTGDGLLGVAQAVLQAALGTELLLADLIEHKEGGILYFVGGGPFVIDGVHLKIAAVIAVNIGLQLLAFLGGHAKPPQNGGVW